MIIKSEDHVTPTRTFFFSEIGSKNTQKHCPRIFIYFI
jgi:hypothetical protein